MNELIELLSQLKLNLQKAAASEANEELLNTALVLASKASDEQLELNDEVERLGQIIRDIRERDAKKNCICRGY